MNEASFCDLRKFFGKLLIFCKKKVFLVGTIFKNALKLQLA
jgi:hypothetical protein